METEKEIMRVNKETAASIESWIEEVYDGDYEGKTSVTLKSGEKMIFSNDVVTQMFKKTLTQQGSGFNVYNALVTLGFSSKEILEEVCGLLIRKSDAWKSLANSIRKILEG